MTVGSLTAFIRYIWQINQPLSQMTQLSSTIQSAFDAMKQVFVYLEEPDKLMIQLLLKSSITIMEQLALKMYPLVMMLIT